jgi:hypothetical protein
MILRREQPERPPPPAFLGSRMVLVFFLLGLGALGCTRYVEADRGPQAYYQTGFPIHDTSEELEEIQEAVHRIRVASVYQTYFFAEEDAPTESRSGSPTLLAQAVDTTRVDRSRAATAVLIAQEEGRLVLLTAGHAVHFPDTIVEYHQGRAAPLPGQPQRTIRSISILSQRTNWIVGLPGLDPFQVLARDDENDLAFLGVEYEAREGEPRPRVLPAAVGRPNRLSLGSFVYVLGFPAGYPMVTRGIVSDPRGEESGSFVVDGLWNEGMSGGLILAVRGDGSGMEWVGMARAAAARSEHRLVPEEGAHRTQDPWRPYEGPIFLEESRSIQYGITLSVPVETIRSFANRHRGELREQGYELPRIDP